MDLIPQHVLGVADEGHIAVGNVHPRLLQDRADREGEKEGEREDR